MGTALVNQHEIGNAGAVRAKHGHEIRGPHNRRAIAENQNRNPE